MHSLKNVFIFGFMMCMFVFVCVCVCACILFFSTRSLIFNEQYHHQVYVLNVTSHHYLSQIIITRLWCITLLCELYISYCVCLQLYCVSVLFIYCLSCVCVRRSFFSEKKTVSYLFIMIFIINRTSEYGL